MKKRLLVVFSVFVLAVVLVLLMGAVFSLKSAELSLYAENGKEILDDTGIDPDLLIEDLVGQSVLFLPESKIIESIHSNPLFTHWRVVAIEKNFPNSIRVHMTKRLPVFILRHGGASYSVDSEGYVIGTGQQGADGFISIDRFAEYFDTVEIGTYLKTDNNTARTQLDILITMVRTIWELDYDYGRMHTFLSDYDYNQGDLIIATRTGAKVIIKTPSENLPDKLISAYGVYSSTQIDMTGENVVITVYDDGTIKTTNDN